MIKKLLIIISIGVLYLIPSKIVNNQKISGAPVDNSQIIVSQSAPISSKKTIKVKNINAPEIISINKNDNFYPDHRLSTTTSNLLLIVSAFFITSGISFLEIDSVLEQIKSVVSKIDFGTYLFRFINKML